MPGFDEVGKRKRGQDEGQDHHGSLGDDQQLAAGQAVCNHAAEEGEQQGGCAADKSHQPEIERGTGNLIDQIALGGTLHPGADQRYHLAAEPQAVIVMFEGGKGLVPALAADFPGRFFDILQNIPRGK